MIERKRNLVTDRHNIIFTKSELEIEVIERGGDYVIKNQNLCIMTDSIYKFAQEFEDLCLTITGKTDLTELQAMQKSYIDSLGVRMELKEEKSTKKRVNSRRKGQRGERLIIEELKPKFPGLNIFRTPTSGAFATIHNMATKDNVFSGDLMAENNEPAQYERFMSYNWEVKNYKDLPNILDLYFKKSCVLADWIDKAERDATLNGKVFTLIFRGNRTPNFIAVKNDFPHAFSPILNFNYKRQKYFVCILDEMSF